MSSSKQTKKVLIVEDDKFISEIYVNKLVSDGFVVDIAEDGQQAIDAIKKDIPDLLLLDIFMPKRGGMDVLKIIRSKSEMKNVIVLVLTNANEREYILEAKRIGANEYMIKSQYTPDEVMSKIKKMLM